MKVYVHYTVEENDDLSLTQKISLPKRWVANEKVVKLHELFIKTYNAKKGAELSAGDTHLELEDGDKLYAEDRLADVLRERVDVHLHPGALGERPAEAPLPAAAAGEAGGEGAGGASAAEAAAPGPKLVRCRNPGCKAMFSEEENSDTACRFHLGPAIFHDRGKGWACCREKHRLVYSWEEFERIPGCQVGRHSAVAPCKANAIEQSPTVAAAQRVQEREAAAPMKTADDFNRENPDAKSGLAVAAKAATAKPKCTRKADGSARCVRKGCQKPFMLHENTATSCSYHTGEPVFWDTSKYWGCCPSKVKYDFDAFLKVPGCQTGYHDDGSGDFDAPDRAEQVIAEARARFQAGVTA